MQEFNRSEWLATEHNRLHSVELWPEGARKEAALSAIRSTLESLSRPSGTVPARFDCIVCQNGHGKKADVTVICPRSTSHFRPNLDRLIALLPTGS